MKKIILILLLMITSATSVFAAKIPDDVKTVIKKDFAKTDFRFDGVVILPDGTTYLPLFPALVKKPQVVEVKNTYPQNIKLAAKPEIIIFNNDFVLLKVLVDQKDRKTVMYMENPPIEVRTGLLPQDMLVPKGLVIPDNIKGIIGNLQIPTAQDAGLRVKADIISKQSPTTHSSSKNLVQYIPQLRNKTLYIATCYSKNIQVVNGEKPAPDYALAQSSIPYDIKASNDDNFLFVTTFSKTFMDIISLADERVIKQIDLTTPAEEIVVDSISNKAYVSSSQASSIYIIDLNSMTLKQKIKVKGMCERLALSPDGKKLFYADKKNNDVWVIELDNNFIIKNIGKFPNISKIIFDQNKIYVLSRTKNRVAIIDYATLALIKEMDVATKPVDMISYKGNVYILSAQSNVVQVLKTESDEITDTIYLNTNGFSTQIYRVKNTNIALVMDIKANKYSVLDLDKKVVLRTNRLDVPAGKVIVTNKAKKI